MPPGTPPPLPYPQIRRGRHSSINPDLREKVYEEDRPRYFDIHLAKEFGLPLAILIGFLDNVLRSGKRNPYVTVKDSIPWFTVSPEYIRNMFPYMSVKQIRTALEDGRKAGIILVRDKLNPLSKEPLAYTLDLRLLREFGMCRTSEKRKYTSPGRYLSIRPTEARDYGMNAACLMSKLECLRYNQFADTGAGYAKQMPSAAQMAATLPMCKQTIFTCLNMLAAAGKIVRPVPLQGSKPSGAKDATVCDLVELTPDPARPAPWEIQPNTDSQVLAAHAKHDAAVGASQGDYDATPEWKAHVLMDAVRLIGRRGYIDTNRMRVINIKIVTTPADETAACAFFARNPACAPVDLLTVLESCAKLCAAKGRAQKSVFDPIWHVRKAARSLRHLFMHWRQVLECMAEKHLTGYDEVCPPGFQALPPFADMYPVAARRAANRPPLFQPASPPPPFQPESPPPPLFQPASLPPPTQN